ncbi:unnamed protein product [Rotaria sp. Silwood1]|nr:unnamed protein product [Rotaria sp. Silwood1]CAF4535394.1 unnamed protein product [Rotaria sp. Silwood1]CAF4559957.1 unnamed protein product [Rotaria sp. Silwood1]CAF4619029.1 unnamed protein product [Rotaria sp. Silwood1]
MRLRRGTLFQSIPTIDQHLLQDKQHPLSWIMSEFVAITAAAAARILFAIHGIAAIWRVALVYKQNKYWFQAITLFGIPAEFFVTLYVNNGHEWKWFCPSVFFYLCTVIPSVWFLELDLAERRSKFNVTQVLGLIPVSQGITHLDTEDTIPLVPWKIPAEMWTQIVEQTLLLVLIIGRWLLPVGKTMTRDQLSQLLLVYIGTAADIIELFEAFKEHDVQRNLTIIHLILTAWSISLMQFTLVVTSTKTRKKRTVVFGRTDSKEIETCFGCRLFWETELWALSTTILLQDGPFLCLRLGLIIHYKIISQSNVFFTTKNFLVVLLQFYRVCVIVIEHRKRHLLARLYDINAINQTPNHLPVVRRKSSIARKKRPGSIVTTPRGSFILQSNSMTNLRPISMNGDHVSFDGNSDPLPRRKHSSAVILNPSSVPSARSTMSHSKSLTIVERPNISSTSHKICTEVASYSTQNEWPYSSPFAGFYDISNTSTGLILLNQRYKFSHLRGKILPKETTRPSEEDYKTFYEAILESEQEPKSKHSHKLLLPRIPVDPYRHFESMFTGQNKYWHNRMCKGSHSVDNTTDQPIIETNMTLRSRRPQTARPFHKKRNLSSSPHRRSQSASGTYDKLIDECQTDPTFAESLWQYYHYVVEKSQRPKLGLQQFHIKEPSNKRWRQSGIYRNPALTHGQKLYLLEKCHIYDMGDTKARHTNAYVQVLTRRFNAGLNDPRDYFTYAKFLKTPRPTARSLNTGYFTSKKPNHPRIPSNHKKQQIDIHSNNYLDKKDFAIRSSSSSTNKKLSKDYSSNSSRRISATSFSTNNENTVTVRLRHEPKQIPKIPVVSSESHD